MRLIALMVCCAALVAAPASFAKGKEVRVRGTCTKASTSKLKLSEEDGRIEVEFEVDQNRNGVRWAVELKRGTAVVARGTRVTRPPSGSFEFRRVVADLPGPDRLSVRATSPTREVCRASAVF